ncbi:hypothetical protein [Roseateles sp. P5_E7]
MSTLSGGVAQGSLSGDLTTRSSAKWGDAGRLRLDRLVAAARLHQPWGSNVPKAEIDRVAAGGWLRPLVFQRLRGSNVPKADLGRTASNTPTV